MKDLPDFKKAVETAYKGVIKEKWERINELIFELRSIADPKLKESYKKYLIGADKGFVSFMENPKLSEEVWGLINQYLGKQEEWKERPPQQEKREKFEKWKKQILEQLYKEKEQKIFFKFVFMLITESFDPDYFDDAEMEFMSEVGTGVYSYLEEELKCLDADARLKLIDITGFQGDPDLFISTLEMTKKIFENDLPDLLKRGMYYLEVISFLEDLIKFYKATSEIKKGIFDLYDPDGSWKPINKEHLAKFLKAIKLKEINENFVKEIMDDSMAIISGRMSSDLENEAEEIEKKLREVIKAVLKKDKGDDWFKKSFSKDTFSMCMKRMQDDKIKDTSDPYHYLDLGGCKIVILEHWAEFEDVFVGSEVGFHDKEHFAGSMNFINTYRKKIHGSPYRSKYDDMSLLKIYLIKINKCVKGFLDK